MSGLDRLERALEREEEILREEYELGAIGKAEFESRLKELWREARDYEREMSDEEGRW
jgi:hypothetical protein